MRILITGGCGFVGSNLAILFKKKYPHYQIISFDNLRRRGSELNLKRILKHEIEFVHGDIRQRQDLNKVGWVDLIIDAAAEPSVLAGLNSGLEYLIDTNLNGTINALYLAKECKANFIFLSTSRVYPFNKLENLKYYNGGSRFNLDVLQEIKGVSNKGITEDFVLSGFRSLYGATKLSSEFMIQEFCQNFGLNAVINRCGVLTGPHQMGKVDQGVVVLWMAKHFWKGNLNYIGYGGEGLQVRDILHVEDLFTLLDIQIKDMLKYKGDIFNVGGGLEISCSLKELTKICEDITGNRLNIVKSISDRPADVPIYITDNSYVTKTTGWEPKISVNEIMIELYGWIKNNENDLKPILS